MRDLPVRGDVSGIGLAVPPARMPAMHRRRPLKRWHYVGVYRRDVMVCIVSARVAGVPQRWWAAALPDGSLYQGRRGVQVDARRARVRGVLELELSRPHGVQVVSPHGRSYVWTLKTAPVHVSGHLHVGGQVFQLDGDDGFVDESAGYHARHTAWRWSAGVGRTEDGHAAAWNLVDGVHDGPASERTVWLDGAPEEVPYQDFAADLSRVGDLEFTEWASRDARLNLGIVRNSYRQPFGEFSGRLPGGLPLAEGYGVMEEHDVLW
jgi:Domain of unknown function (DUF2804), C-terminal